MSWRAGLLAAVAIAIPVAFGGSDYVMGIVVAALTVAAIALAWAMLGNLGGLISFGHSAFFGIGAYASALLSMKLGVSPYLGLLAGGGAAALSAILAIPALRLHGPFFAMAMLAYAQIFRIVVTEWKSVTNGAIGLLSIPGFTPILGFPMNGKLGGYVLTVAIITAIALVYFAIRRSVYGLALVALHHDDAPSQALGVPTYWLKAGMLLLSAFATGVIGAFHAHFLNFLSPGYAFSMEWVILPIAAGIFGGYRRILGPIIGGLVIYCADQLVFKALLPEGHQVLLGAVLVATVVLSTDGIAAIPGRWRAARERPRPQDAAVGGREVSHVDG
jgi:branched-chain amino acid transport system permease protein